MFTQGEMRFMQPNTEIECLARLGRISTVEACLIGIGDVNKCKTQVSLRCLVVNWLVAWKAAYALCLDSLFWLMPFEVTD